MANWQPSERKIQKVPLLLREVKHNSDAYDPKVVSFGPYHHGKPELELCEKAKSLTFELFVDGSGHNQEFFKREVSKILAYARSCYVEGSTDGYTDEQFVDMMVLDACFLIFFMNIEGKQDQRHLSHICNYLGRLVLSMVGRDMFLLENQIPFQVVMLLMNLRYGNTKGEEAVSRYLHQTIWGHYNQQESEEILHQQIRDIHEQKQPPLHLLEASRGVLVRDFCPRSQVNLDVNADLKKFCKTFRSATDLKAKGIHFKPSEKRSLRSISFQSFTFYGELELPVWFVSRLSKVFFLNMIAYELCPNNFTVDTTVISCLNFMKSLIERPADVKELREKRILLTTSLGSDEDVVELYRNLDTSGICSTFIFLEVKRRIQEHYDSKAKTWGAELIHTYLNSPWSIIAWLAGLLLLLLTFLQTYFTIAK